MFGRREPLWVAQGGDSLWGVGMAAIRDYHNPDYQARLQEHSPAKDFYDQSRYTYLICGIGSPWTSEPSDALRTIESLAIVF